MSEPATLISIIELAKQIGVGRHTVGEIVKLHEIPTHPMRHGPSKGLDPNAVKKIKRVLNISSARASA